MSCIHNEVLYPEVEVGGAPLLRALAPQLLLVRLIQNNIFKFLFTQRKNKLYGMLTWLLKIFMKKTIISFLYLLFSLGKKIQSRRTADHFVKLTFPPKNVNCTLYICILGICALNNALFSFKKTFSGEAVLENFFLKKLDFLKKIIAHRAGTGTQAVGRYHALP